MIPPRLTGKPSVRSITLIPRGIVGIAVLTSLVLVATANAGINDGLVLWLPLDGDTNDQSGYGNHGTASGVTAVPDRHGNPNGAVRFDGLNDAVTVRHSASLDITEAISISLWVVMDDAGKDLPLSQYFISKGTGPYFDTSNNTYSLFLGDPTNGSSGITFELSDGRAGRNMTLGASELSSNHLRSDLWYHIAATWDGGTMRLYLNGVLISKADAAFSGPVNSHNSALQIGRLGDVSGYFDGLMDDLRIYDRALSAEEIQTLFFGRLECPAEARYTEADLQAAYQNGFTAGKSTVGTTPEPACASFDVPSATLHVPCFGFGERNYWLDLNLVSPDPIRFELKNLGEQ